MEEFEDSLFESDPNGQEQEFIYDYDFPDVQVLEEGGRSFIWEYAMERVSLHPTQFKDIWPEYE